VSLGACRCQRGCTQPATTAADVDTRRESVIGRVGQLPTPRSAVAAAAAAEAADCSTAACTARNAGPAADESKLLAAPATHVQHSTLAPFSLSTTVWLVNQSLHKTPI